MAWSSGCTRSAVIRDAMRLRGNKNSMSASQYSSRCGRIERRLTLLLEGIWSDGDVLRLLKRLRRHRSELFVFLYSQQQKISDVFIMILSNSGLKCVHFWTR